MNVIVSASVPPLFAGATGVVGVVLGRSGVGLLDGAFAVPVSAGTCVVWVGLGLLAGVCCEGVGVGVGCERKCIPTKIPINRRNTATAPQAHSGIFVGPGTTTGAA